jgi:hypothetical protein
MRARNRRASEGELSGKRYFLSKHFRRPWRLLFGVILMALSFGIYPAYPMVAFLPISRWDKAGVAVGLTAISWSMFLVGSVVVGKKGVDHFRQRFFSRWV